MSSTFPPFEKMEEISKTVTLDESIDEAVEETNFSIVEIEVSSSAARSRQVGRNSSSSSFSIYKMTISEDSGEYQSITGTGRRLDSYAALKGPIMNRPPRSAPFKHTSLSFSSSEGVYELGNSTEYDDATSIFSVSDLANILGVSSVVDDSSRGAYKTTENTFDQDVFAGAEDPSSSKFIERRRTTSVENTLPLEDIGETAQLVEGTKDTTSVVFQDVLHTQHLRSEWCGVNFCAEYKSEVMGSSMDLAVNDAKENENFGNADISSAEQINSIPTTRRLFTMLESAKTSDIRDHSASKNESDRSSFFRPRLNDPEARSTRLMNRMADRAIHYQQSSATIKSRLCESQEESVWEDDASEDELSQATFGRVFTEFLQNPAVFIENFVCLHRPFTSTHDEGFETYITSTNSESTVGSDDEGHIPKPRSSVDPTTSDDSFRSEDQEKRNYRRSAINVRMGMSPKRSVFQDLNTLQSLSTMIRQDPVENDHSIGNHINRTFMILSDDDLSQASDVFSDCDENKGFSSVFTNSTKPSGRTSSKPPLFVARSAKRQPLPEFKLHEPVSTDLSNVEPSFSYAANDEYDDDSLIDYDELNRQLEVEEHNFNAAYQSHYHSFSAATCP